MAEPKKLCKDCEHSRRDLLRGWSFATCEAPQNKVIDPVSGKLEYRLWKYCDVQRTGDTGDCSKVGRWFTPTRKPVWLKLLGR